MSRLAVLLLLALALAASSYSELWNRHVVWTREYAKAAIAHDEAGAATALARLMQNQDDIGRFPIITECSTHCGVFQAPRWVSRFTTRSRAHRLPRFSKNISHWLARCWRS